MSIKKNIDLKLWNALVGIELKNNRVEVIITEIQTTNVSLSSVMGCAFTLYQEMSEKHYHFP